MSSLTKLSSADSSAPDIRRQADEYRAFCLFALGRTGEAETVAENILKKDPFAELDPADASPRLEAMFASVRKRLLPSLIRERVRTARSGLDKKDYPAAEPPLMQARLMIADAEKLGVQDESLPDLGRARRRVPSGDSLLVGAARTPRRLRRPRPADGGDDGARRGRGTLASLYG